MEQHGISPISPPRSPSWLLTGFPSNVSDIQSANPASYKRQSLRLRPDDILENEPPSPLNLTAKSTAPRPVTPRLSLFNLFSRPNVERQRGSAEPDSDVAPARNALRSSKSELVIRLQHDDPPPRPASPRSVLSGKTTATKWTKWKPGKPRQQASKERKPGAFEPPPLFQAYPQSMKDGMLEVASIPVEALNTAKSKSNGSNTLLGEKMAGDRGSIETRRTSALKHLTNGSAITVDLPRKVFVLVTSGYLLQYAEKGTSDRLPEKVLHLGKDSAAFACDLVPGKHYVLQISQAVDQDGIVIANSGSILSRLGIRTAAAKRMTSNLVLVMPNAKEMGSWLAAVRQEIEALGGKKVRDHPAKSAPKDEDDQNVIDLKKTPSQSHRYQIKRNPSRVSLVTSPIATQVCFPPVELDIDFDRLERSTIEDIELDASRLSQTETGSKEQTLSSVDVSISPPSPPMVVVEQAEEPEPPEQQEVENVNETPSESVYISPAKQTITATPWPERKSSIRETARNITDVSEADMERSQESDIITALPNPTTPGSSPSHNFSRKGPPTPLALNTQLASPRRTIIDESPIIPSYPLLSKGMSARLSNAYSERNSSTSTPSRHRHDSKVVNPLPASREESPDILAELQNPDLNLLSPVKNVDSYLASNPRVSLPNPSSTASVEIDRTRKVASFSMPLRVNPTATQGSISKGNVRRHSRMDEPGYQGESKVGYALTPPIEATTFESSGTFLKSSTPSPPSDGSRNSPPSNSPPGRLSLFPAPRPTPTPSVLPNNSFKRSSAGSLRTYQSAPVLNGATPLRRPNSMQIRPNHGPFVVSSRNSTGSPPSSTTTIPIRGMKPSRPTSTSNAFTPLARPQNHHSAVEEFKALRFDTPTVIDEEVEVDLAMPLPAERSSIAAKPKSRNSVRKSLKGRSSLPDMDFGIPLVGLGPPAPPPQAPLPAPPPPPTQAQAAPAGLGITVS